MNQEIDISKILDTAFKRAASHIFLNVGKKPTLLVNGEQVEFPDIRVLESKDMISLMQSTTTERDQDILQETGLVRYGFAYGEKGRCVETINQSFGNLQMDIKLAPPLRTLEELGLNDLAAKMTQFDSGLIVVTGHNGSGRSTTLNALVDEINANQARRITIIGNPTETIHASKKGTIINRQVGLDILTLSDALAQATASPRQVICVDTDLETPEIVRSVLQAVRAGHLVLATGKSHNPGGEGHGLYDVLANNQTRVGYPEVCQMFNCSSSGYVGFRHINQHIDFENREFEAKYISSSNKDVGDVNTIKGQWCPPEYNAG